MLDQEQFTFQLMRLAKKWTDKYADSQLNQKLYQVIKKSDPKDFQNFVTEGLGSHRAPLLPEFREFAKISFDKRNVGKLPNEIEETKPRLNTKDIRELFETYFLNNNSLTTSALRDIFNSLDRRTCKLCWDGLVSAHLQGTRYRYEFRCGCRLGDKQPTNYPVWRSDYLSRYKILEQIEDYDNDPSAS